MSRKISIRLRMLILFCTVVGTLLALTFGGFYLVFERAVRGQLDRRLQETAAPIIADLIMDPDEKDVDQLNIDQNYFEVLDASGRVSQRSKNLPADLPLTSQTEFQSARIPAIGDVRIATVPFEAGGRRWTFVAASSTRDVEGAVTTLRNFALLLFPASLLLTALIFRFYSNQLFSRIDSAVGQLRQFVSDASHELRTPLAVLHGETELLLTRPRTTTEYESAARILDDELKKLSRIVEGLFTLSMADAGQLRIATEPLYLEEVLEESCALAAPMAQQKQICIERDLQSDVLYSGDAAFLRQLFLIFIDNAIKYSPSGTRLHVSLSASDEVQIRFKDEGIGIAREHLSRIFERFFRAPQAGAPENHSGGLGLAIAQAIVQAHHGSIECVSQPGQGSIFTVRLPLTPAMSGTLT
jgi:signal transduction histidine kinase